MAKNMTIEDLALLLKRSLAEQTKSFDTKLAEQTKSFDTKLAEQTKSFDTKLEMGFAKQAKLIDDKIEQLAISTQKQFMVHSERFDRLEDGQIRLEEIIGELADRVRSLENLVSGLRDDSWEIKAELRDAKVRLTHIEKRTIEDDDAFARDIVRLNAKIKVLEKKCKMAH